MSDDPCTVMFDLEVGALVRGSVKRRIKLIAFRNDLTVKFEEDKGFLSSYIIVRLDGDLGKCLVARGQIREYLEPISDGRLKAVR
jgi:hypothetical protein